MDLTIRNAEKSDIDSIAKNVLAMALDGSGVELVEGIVLKGVRSIFEKPDLGFYVVAESNKKIVGSLVIVFEWSDWRNGVHWWIHSVYVDPNHRRKGIYRKMYHFEKNQSKADPHAMSVNLSVNKNNEVARKTYESLGMVESSSVIYHARDL